MANMQLSMEDRVIDSTKFEELCRLCGTRASIMIAYNIFEGEGVSREICKKIETCLQIQVHHQDNLPKLICENCFYKLELFYEFRARSLKTEQLLIELCKQIKYAADSINLNQQCVVDQDGGLIMVPNHQLLSNNLSTDIEMTNLTERAGVLIGQTIILDHATNLHQNSLDNLNLNSHDLSNQSLASLQGTEPIMVSESERLTQDNFNLMQQQQFILNEQFRLHQELQVSLTDESSLNNYRISEIKDLSNINPDAYDQQGKPVAVSQIPTINFSTDKNLAADSNMNDESLDAEVNTHLNNIISYSSDSQLDNLGDDENSQSSNLLNVEIHRVITKEDYLPHEDADTQDARILQSNQGYFACTLCGKSFESKTAFEVHYDSHYPKCESCMLGFATKEALYIHRKTCGRPPDKEPEDDQNSNDSEKLAIVENDNIVEISVNPNAKISSKVDKPPAADPVKIEDLEDEKQVGDEVIPDTIKNENEELIKDDFDDNQWHESPSSPQGPACEEKIEIFETPLRESFDPIEKTKTDTNNTAKIDKQSLQNLEKPITPVKKKISNIKNTSKIDEQSAFRKSKTSICNYCRSKVTNFERHLQRKHDDEKEVIRMLSFPTKHPERKRIISLIRNSGNFKEFLQGRGVPQYRQSRVSVELSPCSRCKALLSKKYLSRHKKKCIVKCATNVPKSKTSEAAESQTLIAASLQEGYNIQRLRVTEEVFSRMRADDISLVAKSDYLICTFGENYLKKHKHEHLATVCSNKIRELARFLITFRKYSGKPNCTFQEVLIPSQFEPAVECAKILGGYNVKTKNYDGSANLPTRLGTSLKQVCDIFSILLVKEDPFVKVDDREKTLRDTKMFYQLVESEWNTKISSVAFKTLQEEKWEKPVLLPLTSDVKIFKEYITGVADKAVAVLKKDPSNKQGFKNLVESSLILTILFNRRRIGDVQYTCLKTFTNFQSNEAQQKEIKTALSPTEKILTKHYKRIVTGEKGSRAITILLPRNLQEYIELFISIRAGLVPDDNKYLFACPGTTKWTQANVIIRKYAEKAGVKNPSDISSNKLRKQIATVMQILNLTPEECKQFSRFMGHTQKRNDKFYKLPQDIYQTAKVSKLLLLMEKGAKNFKGKSLSEIDINPETDYAEENSDIEDSVLYEPKAQSPAVSQEEKNEDINLPLGSRLTGRTPWNAKQIKLIKAHFKEHIRLKQAPKKGECLKVINKYPHIFHNKDWVRVKTFVYNTYRPK